MNAALVAERRNRGLSHADAATAIGISRMTLIRAEKGLTIQASKAKLIADFYEAEVTTFWPVDESARTAA